MVKLMIVVPTVVPATVLLIHLVNRMVLVVYSAV